MNEIHKEFELNGISVAPGEKAIIDIHLARMYDSTLLTLPVQVIRGQRDGPIMFISGAIHGDEIIGTEIIKRISCDRRLKSICGTLIAIPIVNVFGFNSQSRYLPDRRDLNRCFPGNAHGSLASRIANVFMKEIVSKCQYGIDFHSGAIHRSNLPQIRTDLKRDSDRRLAECFGAPVILNSKLRDGSLRAAAAELKKNVLVFEGGEALRVDDAFVRVGVQGAFAVMEHIGMLPPGQVKSPKPSYVATSSYWIRAPQSGIIAFKKQLGNRIRKGARLASVSDAFGRHNIYIVAPSEGIVIGLSRNPLVNKGDAVYHIATFEDSETVRELEQDLDDFTSYFG